MNYIIQHSNGHKYIKRWWKNGHWNYEYPDELNKGADATIQISNDIWNATNQTREYGKERLEAQKYLEQYTGKTEDGTVVDDKYYAKLEKSYLRLANKYSELAWSAKQKYEKAKRNYGEEAAASAKAEMEKYEKAAKICQDAYKETSQIRKNIKESQKKYAKADANYKAGSAKIDSLKTERSVTQMNNRKIVNNSLKVFNKKGISNTAKVKAFIRDNSEKIAKFLNEKFKK